MIDMISKNRQEEIEEDKKKQKKTKEDKSK